MDYPTQYIKFDQIQLTKTSVQKNDKRHGHLEKEHGQKKERSGNGHNDA
jgi:hypothetical protein